MFTREENANCFIEISLADILAMADACYYTDYDPSEFRWLRYSSIADAAAENKACWHEVTSSLESRFVLYRELVSEARSLGVDMGVFAPLGGGYNIFSIAGTHRLKHLVHGMASLCGLSPQLAGIVEFMDLFHSRPVRRDPPLFIGHSLGGFFAMRAAQLTGGKYIAINPLFSDAHAGSIDVEGINILSEHDPVIGWARRLLPGTKVEVRGTGISHGLGAFSPYGGLYKVRFCPGEAPALLAIEGDSRYE